ncbi:uncharacterized protein LOC143182841 [Calliopsis andreniformis]|uniref:uncharacterized protein LOC143182841 n=1 Tax=Calliopsis andreniformis TaxID=337506 RepID=UPI003FCE3171
MDMTRAIYLERCAPGRSWRTRTVSLARDRVSLSLVLQRKIFMSPEKENSRLYRPYHHGTTKTRFSFRSRKLWPSKHGQNSAGRRRCSRWNPLSARWLLSSTREIKIRSLPLTTVGTTARLLSVFSA